MGGAIAQRIIDAGFSTVLWARRPEALEPFVAPNVEFASSPADLAARADVIGVCVWADEDVRQVIAGEGGLLAGCRPGTVLAVHSTTLPETCRQLARVAAERGVALLDAPVSGGRNAAVAGSLLVIVGGDEADSDRCRPVFDAFAQLIVHAGSVGAAQHAKLINNALLAANLALADDALSLGEALGIEWSAMGQILRRGSGSSFGVELVALTRSSGATRRAALPSLQKDVKSLVGEAAPDECRSTELFINAATEGVRRLESPPAGWAQD